jgi:hypothetical protein
MKGTLQIKLAFVKNIEGEVGCNIFRVVPTIRRYFP